MDKFVHIYKELKTLRSDLAKAKSDYNIANHDSDGDFVGGASRIKVEELIRLVNEKELELLCEFNSLDEELGSACYEASLIAQKYFG